MKPFNNSLHSDLFDLFILAIISDGNIDLCNEDTLNYVRGKVDSVFYMFRDLFELENKPEQFLISRHIGKKKMRLLCTILENYHAE